MARAPASMASTSMPWSAAGRRPTAESSLVRPPTQSHMGKRARKPFAAAYLSSSLPIAGDRHRVLAEVEAQALVLGAAASSMPLRVSLVPPLLEMTTVRVRARPSPMASKTRSMPSGSVLSRKNGRIRSPAEPSASAHELGPERRAADADHAARSSKRAARSGRRRPPWTRRGEGWMRGERSPRSPRGAPASGASSGARSQ